MMDEKERKVYLEAISEFGAESQIVVAIEELSELIQALTKTLRGEGTYTEQLEAIADELADVEIMCAQLRVMFDLPNEDWKKRGFSTRVNILKGGKLDRIKDLLMRRRLERAAGHDNGEADK